MTKYSTDKTDEFSMLNHLDDRLTRRAQPRLLRFVFSDDAERNRVRVSFFLDTAPIPRWTSSEARATVRSL